MESSPSISSLLDQASDTYEKGIMLPKFSYNFLFRIIFLTLVYVHSTTRIINRPYLQLCKIMIIYLFSINQNLSEVIDKPTHFWGFNWTGNENDSTNLSSFKDSLFNYCGLSKHSVQSQVNKVSYMQIQPHFNS